MDKLNQEAVKPLKYKNSLEGISTKLGMIIRFYFPDLNKDYQDFIKVFIDITQKTITLEDKINLTDKDIKKLYVAYGSFINKIVLESKKYV